MKPTIKDWINAIAKLQNTTSNALIAKIVRENLSRYVGELASHLGVKKTTVQEWLKGNATPKSVEMKEMLEDLGLHFEYPNLKKYVFYKGNDVVCEGTIDECAKALGTTTHTARILLTPQHHSKDKGNAIVGYRLEE